VIGKECKSQLKKLGKKVDYIIAAVGGGSNAGGIFYEFIKDESELRLYMQEAVDVSDKSPVLIDQYLDNATEIDVDAISDGK
ncbi:hypothetical protein VWO06_10105, partial [Campylobacter coli]